MTVFIICMEILILSEATCQKDLLEWYDSAFHITQLYNLLDQLFNRLTHAPR